MIVTTYVIQGEKVHRLAKCKKSVPTIKTASQSAFETFGLHDHVLCDAVRRSEFEENRRLVFRGLNFPLRGSY